jgi:hypothetical protein
MTTKILSLVLFIVTLLIIPKSYGDAPTSEVDNKVELSLTPLACFVKESGDICNITIKVNWQSNTPINTCLYQNNEKMHCWQDTRRATKKISVSLSENMLFALRADNNEVYAQQHVSIATSTSKKYRRRLRADWSFF